MGAAEALSEPGSRGLKRNKSGPVIPGSVSEPSSVNFQATRTQSFATCPEPRVQRHTVVQDAARKLSLRCRPLHIRHHRRSREAGMFQNITLDLSLNLWIYLCPHLHSHLNIPVWHKHPPSSALSSTLFGNLASHTLEPFSQTPRHRRAIAGPAARSLAPQRL